MINELYKMAISGPWKTIGLGVDYNITDTGNSVIMSFCGTCFPNGEHKLTDIAVDLACKPIGYNCRFYPEGFLKAILSAGSIIEKTVMQALVFNRAMVFTGFSLGGAMAAMAHMIYGESESTCITFGAPRTRWGIGGFLLPKDPRITHYVVDDDPIPMLAPSVLGYYHPGKVIKLGKCGSPWIAANVSDCSHMSYARMTEGK
jgi:hypothetical protein